MPGQEDILEQATTLRTARMVSADRIAWLAGRTAPASALIVGHDPGTVVALLRLGVSVVSVVETDREAAELTSLVAPLPSASRLALTVARSLQEIEAGFPTVIISPIPGTTIHELVIKSSGFMAPEGDLLLSVPIGNEIDLPSLRGTQIRSARGGVPLSHVESRFLAMDTRPLMFWLSSWISSAASREFDESLLKAVLVASDQFAAMANAWAAGVRRKEDKASHLQSQLELARQHIEATTAELVEAQRQLLRQIPTLDESPEAATLVAEPSVPSLVSPVGYRRVVGGRLALVGSLVSGRVGSDGVLDRVEVLSRGPGVDVFGLVRGVGLPEGVRVFGGQIGGDLIQRLRSYAGVVDHPALHDSPSDRAEALMTLAAGGVPVVTVDTDPDLGTIVGSELADVLTSASVEELADPETRDRLSIRLRRIGLSSGSQNSKWREIAGSLGLAVGPPPTVSVVLATNRPHFVEHALDQVKAQNYPKTELVLVLHGDEFTQTDQQIQDLYQRPLVIVRVPSQTVYGEALNKGVAASTGAVVAKMDDDDWYSPHHLSDLIQAMDYSGADLVGKAAEFVYLEDLDITIRRMVEGAETYGNRNLGGGTFLIKRTTLDNIGGWQKVNRHVDQALLDDLESSNVAFYRTFGHGYILHRRTTGHTWQANIDYFLDQSEVQHRGLARNYANVEDA